MNKEFKQIIDGNEVRYVLEDGGSTTTGAVATVEKPLGELQRRAEPPKPRNFVAKNAKMGGAGQHKDKKKAEKQGSVKHKKPFMEGFNGEYDDEAGMAQSNLLSTARAVMGLLKTIKDRDNLPEWGQEKIAKAEMMLVGVWDYLQSQKAMGNDPQQDVDEATGDKRFDAMMGQIQREPTIPDSQMPPTDVKDLYQWAVKNNKPYHKIFAEWANREGYKSVAPALQKAGDLDSDALDYWTPDVWKIWYGPDSEMPQGWSKERVPDELRDYLETVFDAYENIWQDWPTEYRQIGMAEDPYFNMLERSVSQAQHNLMVGVANNPQFAQKVKVKQQVGQEFAQADQGHDISALPIRVPKKK